VNPSTLTAKEILRMCSPSTDLEVRLFGIVKDLQDDLDDALDAHSDSCDCCSWDDCEDCQIKVDYVESAIGLIESGKVQDGLEKLKAIA
jgi:hypothetical protein